MKLYDGGKAPNPRRTRIFLAEKGITVPTEPVDIMTLEHKKPEFSAMNPMQRVPVLVLDDGTCISESIAICRYFEALRPEPPLFGQGALEVAMVEMWNRRAELNFLFIVAHAFRHLHPAMKELEVPQVPEWGEANKPRAVDFLRIVDRELADREFIAGDRYTVADITAMVGYDFLKVAKSRCRKNSPMCGAGMRRCRRGRARAHKKYPAMKLTIIGSGDAFGSGGRTNTCFFLETARATLLVDCGASALPALKAQGIPLNDIDAVVLSHLHGDHFGGLPFFLLDARFLSKREKPLLIAGPPGTQERLTAAMEAFFPKSSTSKWSFDWRVAEIAVGVETDVLGHSLTTAEVIHQSGAPSTALRLSDGEKTFAYSGDTEWTDALLPIARDADLFICECYAYAGKLTGHMSWEILKEWLGDLGAKRTMITHMNPTMLAKTDDAKAAGVLVAADGLKFEF